MGEVTQVIFNERQALAHTVMDADNDRVIVIVLQDGTAEMDYIGDIGRFEMIGVLHDLINQQLNPFDADEEEETN